MLINNTEALKSWLVVILEPLCDADSSALARYVLALLKKDKPEKELKRLMIEQLDVFLAEETKPFVERLFEAINNEEYLKTPLPTANNPNILSSTDFEDAEETSTANNAATTDTVTIATIGAVAANTTNDGGVNAAILAMSSSSSSSSLLTTGSSTVTNVINQNDNADTINNMTAKVIDNNTATSSTHADKVNTPPIDDSKTKDTTTERTSSSTSHQQSSSSSHHHHQQQQQQQQHVAGHHHHHNASSNRNETNLYVAGSNSSSSNNDPRHHPRSASPPAARGNAADKENQPRESRRRRASLRSRSRSPRSRSRSNERFSRRSRSPRDRRVNEREKVQRQFRNKSPPMGGGGGGDSRHDRRRGGGGGGADRRRMNMMNNLGGASSGDRSPRFGGGGDRRGSGGGGGNVGGGASGNRSTNRSPISPRSRSPSLERGGRSGKGSPSAGRSQNRGIGGSGGVGANTSPDSRHHHHLDGGEKRQRCRDFDEKGYCVRGETCPWDHGVNPVVFEGINNTALISMSLREYNPDAPDLWTRSAPPPGALVVPGASSGALMAGAAAAGINPFTGAARPGPGMMGGPAGSIGFPQVPGTDKTTNGAGPLAAAEYARTAAAAAAAGAGFRAAAPMMPFPFNPAAVTTPLQRELIPIPVVDASGGSANAGGDVTAAMQAHSKRRFELEDSVAIADGPTKRKIPAHSRLGPRVPSLQNSSLELRKVPRGLNTIAHLNNHFAKFGKIVNIQISYDGDPEAAIVTFSTHAEANVAYRSTEAVLNNRFIKVFWHTADNSGGSEGNSAMNQQTGGRKNSQYHLNNVPAVPTPSADSAKTANTSQLQTAAGANAASNNSGVTTSTHDTSTTSTANSGSSATTTTVAASHVPQPSLRLKNNIPPRNTGAVVNSAVFRKKQEEQVKAVAQLANGLRKRKQELLQSYVKQMKSALDLVERCEPTDPQRGKTLETIKVLQETIDKLRKEIAAEQEQIQAQMHNQNQPPPVKKSKEQQKKELLDIELELFAQQQEGNDTTAIQKRLEELQRSIGIVPGSAGAMSGGGSGSPMGVGKPGGHYMSGGRPMARGRASYPEGSTRVDRRPKTIVVTGFSSEDSDFVLGHFKHFGEITKHDMDLEKPQLILSYATRINAEQAVVRGKLFKDKRLQIAWAPVVQTPPSLMPTAGNKTTNTPNVDIKTSVNDANQKNQTQEATTAISSPNPSQTNSETDANNTDTLPELRLEDEEEDEESEDRTWRR